MKAKKKKTLSRRGIINDYVNNVESVYLYTKGVACEKNKSAEQGRVSKLQKNK